MGAMPAGREKGADAKGGKGGKGGPQTFRSPTALIIWWVWLLFAAANLIDLAVQGRDHLSLVAAAILVLATGIAYVTAQRPRIIADDAGLTIRNPLRDHHVGWAGVTEVDLADLLRVHARTSQTDQQTKVISAWAVHYSRRRQLVAEKGMRRASTRASARRSSLGLPYGPSDGGSRGYGLPNANANAPVNPLAPPDEAEAEKIARQLSERATAARAEEVWAEGTVPIAGPQATPQAAPQATAETAKADVDLTSTGWLEPLKSTWSQSAIAALIIPALILLIVALL
ncbi:MAG TPA: PH domain-containing protein [Streptosporangiaceae bacterium]|nr:PH domain-containing protein [Streptosporangiaceae bacterium]